MKLLSISHTPDKGGANISWLNTLKGLKSLGCEILVIVSAEGFMSAELKKMSIPYEIVPFYFNVYPKFVGSFNNRIMFLPRLLYHNIVNYKAKHKILEISKRYRPELIHCNGSVVNIGLYSANKLNIPHIWHLREYTDIDFNYHLIPYKKRYFNHIRESSYSIAITQEIYNHFGLNPNYGKVIYNGILDKIPDNLDYTKKDLFVYVGTVTENKGVTDLIEAFIQYRKSGGRYELLVIGACASEYKIELNSKLENNKLVSCVKFLGDVNNVDEYMRMSKAIIVSSKNEGFGRITAEAMANRCLVIGRDTAGTKMQLDKGRDVAKFEIGKRFLSNTELVRCMFEVERMSVLEYSTIVNTAQNIVRKLYSITNNVDRTYAFMSQILNKRNKIVVSPENSSKIKCL